jgi:hypothetical protein
MRTARINLSKLDKSALYKGKEGIYLDVAIFDNKDGRDRFENDGFITQDLGKERRIAGERGEILGNWRELEKSAQSSEGSPGSELPQGVSDDDIPF